MQNLINNHLRRRSLLSLLLWPLSVIWGSLMLLRRRFASTPPKLPCKVVSIGNITAGGTGKTPVTIALATALKQAGYNVGVSHRGYKGEFENNPTLIGNLAGLQPNWRQAGDEAALLAQNLPGIPVVAGRDRYAATQLLLQNFADIQIVILDDSFQNLKLHHDLDLLVFNSSSGLGNGFTLPAGLLREPLAAAKYAQAFIVNGSTPLPRLQRFNKPVFYQQLSVTSLRDSAGNLLDVDALKGKTIGLVSGIGYPTGFEQTVRALGLDFVKHLAFADHYAYPPTGLKQVQGLAQTCNYILTTAKDYVKLVDVASQLNLVVVETGMNGQQLANFVCQQLF